MAFGLKNAGATYQRIINRLFSTQISRNMVIYVDDMLIKSQEVVGHEANLRERFDNLGRYKLHLNPDKCVFGAMQSPNTQKEAQCLTRKIASLTRFISRAGDRNLPFFKAIKKGIEFEQTLECEKFFQELKAYLQYPQLLARPVIMRGAETRYPLTEKLVYALIVADRKLKPYFEAHQVEVVTDLPLRHILENSTGPD
ncbi:hypothetical protein LIER_34645 [Lithospermum erythrorhizon]|uniref:Reverse transcriptase domain-containing protein n=1 Tax=Lithospermum erythrorhizon TaxID=34254 RepID=A0AAV3S1H5_LITER